MEEWSIKGGEDLFADTNGTLDDVMESLASNAVDMFPGTNFLERDIGQAIQVVTFTPSTSADVRVEKISRKKILKPALKTTGDEGKVVSLKKVTFDVEKFAADECGDAAERDEARARLALRLGARPPKNRFINYKKLKEELNMKKHREAEFDKLSALKALKKLSLKKKAKEKKIRRK